MNRWRLIGLRLHLLVGVSAGLLLAVMGATGALMAFEDEIIAWLNPPLQPVQASLSEDPLHYARLLPALQRTFKAERITLLQANDSKAVIVGLAGKGRPARVLVNAASAQSYGPVRGSAFFIFVRQLHRWLALPGQANGPGKRVTGVMAICLALLVVSGAWLGWKQYRSQRRDDKTDGWRDRRRYRRWHIRYGFWLMPLLLWSTLTGLWWSFDWYRNTVITVFGGHASGAIGKSALIAGPSLSEQHTKPASAAQLGMAIDAALSELPAHTQRILVTLPRQAGQPIRLRLLPMDASHDHAYDEYRIEATTGQILGRQKYENRRLSDRLNYLMEPLHTGTWFGWPVRILLAVSSLSLCGFVVTGLMMYILRRRRMHTGHKY